MEHSEQERLTSIVTDIINSPQLRNTLENAVRSLSNQPQNIQNLPSNGQGSTSIRQELSRLFPSVRRSLTSPLQGTRKKKKTAAVELFSKDVILLTSPNAVHTLKGVHKSRAYETGLAMSEVKFNTTWKYADIIQHIGELYSPLLLGKTYDVLLPIGGRLVKPSLAPGEELVGDVLKRLFHQKILYVRPHEHITESPVGQNIVISDDEPSLNEIAEAPVDQNIGTLGDELNLNEFAKVQDEFDAEFDASEMTFQHELSEAIQNSMNDKTVNSIEDILSRLKNKINRENVTQFNVYREDIFNCCVRALKRKTFCPFNQIDVKFSDIEGTSEGAVDVGGPKREMFRLVTEYIKDSQMFVGAKKKHISLNQDALENNRYFDAGRILALSLVHGGPAPHFFSDILFMLIVDGFYNYDVTMTDVQIEDEIKEKILKVREFNTLPQLQDYVISEQVFSISGCYVINSFEEKEKLICDTLTFYAVHRVRPALEQFISGLKTCDIHDYMVRYPQMFRPLMCDDKLPLSAEVFQHLFNIKLTEPGSNKRIAENRIISFWRDYLYECQDGDNEITLVDIIVFATGADGIPPLGFPETPTIQFLHEEKECLYPKANTCGLELHLPVYHTTYDKFKYYMNFGIGNSKDFAYA